MHEKPFTFEHLFEAAVDAYEHDDLERASGVLATIFNMFPPHPGALHLGGLIALREHTPEKALHLLQRAEQLAPNHAGILLDTAQTLCALGLWDQAFRTYEAALKLAPDDKSAVAAYAEALMRSGNLDRALIMFRQGISLDRDDSALHNSYAFALNLHGDYQESIREFEIAVSLSPDNPDFIGNLATLYENTNQLELAEETAAKGLTLQPDHDTLSLVMAKCLRRRNNLDLALDKLDRLHLETMDIKTRRAVEFEYGRILDAADDSSGAFVHFTKGNELARSLWPDIDSAGSWYRNSLEHIGEVFTADWIASWASINNDKQIRTPVFMVGFPRSGTTLLDTLLGTYPDIAVLEERPTIDQIVLELSRFPGGYPQALSTLTESEVESLRAIYWRSANQYLAHGGTDAKVVLDKQPLNSIHAGLIHRLFPAAKFIYVSRHPCDICLSCFMQEFGPNPAYASFLNLNDAARCYTLVMDLWEKYTTLLPIDSHTIRYEDLVQDQRSAMGSLIEYLGIRSQRETSDHTEHAQRRGRIYTPSYHQVVRPIYKDSMFKWKRYAERFGGALDILRPAIDMGGYSV